MKKLILFFLVMSVICTNVKIFANVSDYTFSSHIGTYNELVGGIIVDSATHTSIDPFQLNDVTYGPIALGFTFGFNNCTEFTSYYINTNGYITFGEPAPAFANYGPISSSETYAGAISAFGVNLIGVFGTTIDFSGVTNVLTDVRNFQGVVVGRMITAATGIPANTFITAFDEALRTITISNNTTDIIVNDLVVQIASGSITRKIEGITPFQVHTIQFKNFRQYIIQGTDDNFNFQIKLFEFTGEIHIIYGNMDKNPTPVASVSAQVGLRGLDNTDWNNRTNFGNLNWAISSPGTSNAATSELTSTLFPVSGQTYVWTPDCVLPVELSSFISLINGRDVTLNWTTASEINNSRFEIERSVINGQWSKIGSVEGNGTTLSATNYSFTDKGLNTGSYNYRLKQIDFNGNFEYFNLHNEVTVGIPSKYDLMQNYPNPFNPTTTINYDLPSDSKVTLKIFDMTGREVSTLVNEFKTAGYYSVNYTGNNLSSGIYVYTLTANNIVITKKMTMLK